MSPDLAWTAWTGRARIVTYSGVEILNPYSLWFDRGSAIFPPPFNGPTDLAIMMKLHRLQIAGFKSFPDPVEVSFAGGITAIVGPNGCGKSNLSDAITWVLGEQSAKSLRSRTMEDVIFNGSDKRQPLGMGEVTLELLTDPSFEYAEDGKLSIGRRVFRSGDSQYRLNGKVVRLKQVKDLLMDTGLGIRAYSVIEQGKIGMILSGKPQERRKLLEEAAGITRYKARKRIAEVKLEEVTGNLLRLDDIISEVERALRSLKRQASAARRYRLHEGTHLGLLKLVLFGRWSLLSLALAELEQRLHQEVDQDAGLSAELSRDSADLSAGREDLDRLASAVAEAHQRHADLAATIEGRQEYLKGARQTRQEIVERHSRGQQHAAERNRSSAADQNSLGELDQRSQELVSERDAAAEQVAEDDRLIAAADQALVESEGGLVEQRQRQQRTAAEVEQLRAAMQREQIEIERRTFRRRFLEEERGNIGQQLAEASQRLAEIETRVTAARGQQQEGQQQRQQMGADLDRALAAEAKLGDERRQLESKLAGDRQRQQILAELSAEHAERRRSLIEILSGIGLDQPRFLADLVRPVEGWEHGIDHFLGQLADAVVLTPGDDGLALADRLANANASGIFLLPQMAGSASGTSFGSTSPGTNDAQTKIDDPAISQPLASALGLSEELGRALPPAFLVNSVDDAARLASQHPGVAFISRQRHWALAGTLRVQREQAAPGILARESELETLAECIPQNELRLEEKTLQLRQLVDQRTALAGEIRRLDERLARLEREIAVDQARRQDSLGRRDKFAASIATIAEEQQEIDRQIGTATKQKQELAERLAEAEKGLRQAVEEIAEAVAAVDAARQQREAVRTAGAGRRGKLELLEERLQSQQRQGARMRRQLAESHRQIQLWSEEEDALATRLRELELNMEKAEETLQIALEQRAGAQEAVLIAQTALDQRRQQVRTLEDRVETHRRAREDYRGRIEELRIERAGLRQDSEHQARAYFEAFDRYLPGTLPRPQEQLGLAAGDETDDPAANDTAAELDPATLLAGEVTEAGDPAVEASTDDGEPEQLEEGETAAAAAVMVEEDDLPEAVDRERLAQLEAELADCKRILERLGPVNVLAAEEYDEQDERHGFLTTQRGDIASSMESLRNTIREINEVSSERFLETFEAVNSTFSEMFTRLFRGGEASMGLLDPEDPLDTGIEIVARPPGKRPQSIMLLSGGEKALTAIALLFALFKTKPSPFCILDEVDAPLDDANVLRFVDCLREMAQDTQFLVVTHNKLSMEVAGTLYGVTMEERGVSKLVAVEVEDLHPEATAATA